MTQGSTAPTGNPLIDGRPVDVHATFPFWPLVRYRAEQVTGWQCVPCQRSFPTSTPGGVDRLMGHLEAEHPEAETFGLPDTYWKALADG